MAVCRRGWTRRQWTRTMGRRRSGSVRPQRRCLSPPFLGAVHRHGLFIPFSGPFTAFPWTFTTFRGPFTAFPWAFTALHRLSPPFAAVDRGPAAATAACAEGRLPVARFLLEQLRRVGNVHIYSLFSPAASMALLFLIISGASMLTGCLS